MIPEAVPRVATGTLVPSLVAATEDRPIPAPPAATHIGSAHVLLTAGMSAASETAMIARPALTRRCGGQRASAGAASAEPAMTATLNGSSINPATSGLCPRVFCRYSVAKKNIPNRPPMTTRNTPLAVASERMRNRSSRTSGAGERRSRAEVGPVPEGQVVGEVGAVEVEVVAVLEDALVAVGARRSHHHALTFAEDRALDLGVAEAAARDEHDGRGEAEALLDGPRQRLRVRPEPVLQAGDGEDLVEERR